MGEDKTVEEKASTRIVNRLGELKEALDYFCKRCDSIRQELNGANYEVPSKALKEKAEEPTGFFSVVNSRLDDIFVELQSSKEALDSIPL